jgi:DNA-binding TFAR19-related protein (PDSD5 family)
MADDELAAIRAARLKELQQQSGQVESLSMSLTDYIAKQRRGCW